MTALSDIIREMSFRNLRQWLWTSVEPGLPKSNEGSVASVDERAKLSVRSDNPIRRLEEDSLGRAALAVSFAHQVVGLDASEGIVVGVLGPWGSGKTSFVNLARLEFARGDVPMLEFNPWMFSGVEQLVESFFVELAAQLKLSPGLADVGQEIADYGEAFSGMGWLPFVGPWIERGRGALKILGKMMASRREGVVAKKAKLERALAKLTKPIVVFVDDIDRLATDEIRQLFKLVRLTASLPNMVYIVAFDRERVEEALADTGVPGRLYLEKILQIAIDLPAIPESVLSHQILSNVDEVLAMIEKQGPFDEQRWPDVFHEIVRPLVRNMRDVRRYAAAIRGTVGALDGQIALVDVLALEAVRVLLPDVFGRLHGAVKALTSTSNLMRERDSPELKAQIDGIIQVDKQHADIVRELISRIFPAALRHMGGSIYGDDWTVTWRRERRAAHEDILKLYLERVAGEGFKAFIEAEQAWTHLAEQNALDAYLRSLDKERLQGVIGLLEFYEDQFESKHVVPATIVLLNILPDLPKKQGMLEFDRRIAVHRMTYRLLRKLPGHAAVEAAARQILPKLTTLSSKFELILQVGYREGAGHKLVSEAAAGELEKEWREEVYASSVPHLLREWDLARVLLVAKREGEGTKGPLKIDASPEMTLALLRAVRADVRSQALGSRSVRLTPQLGWDVLIQLYGDEATLNSRIAALKATHPEGTDDLMQLVDKYLAGWRPDPFGE